MQGVIVLALDVERPAQKSEYIRDSEQKNQEPISSIAVALGGLDVKKRGKPQICRPGRGALFSAYYTHIALTNASHLIKFDTTEWASNGIRVCK